MVSLSDEYTIKLTCSLSQDSPPVKVVNTLAAVALVSSDSDLLEAAISELANIPSTRVLVEDLESHVPLVLSTHALMDDKPEEAIQAYEKALQLSPADWRTRNRLAKLLLDDERYDQVIGLLEIEIGSGISIEVRSEMMRLRGSAKILKGDKRGLGDLMGAMKIQPSSEKAWSSIQWGLKASEGLPEPEPEIVPGEEKNEVVQEGAVAD